MTVDGERFITQMLRAIHADVSDIRSRMTNMAMRPSAMGHRLAGVETHLSALQHAIDGLTAEMRRGTARVWGGRIG